MSLNVFCGLRNNRRHHNCHTNMLIHNISFYFPIILSTICWKSQQQSTICNPTIRPLYFFPVATIFLAPHSLVISRNGMLWHLAVVWYILLAKYAKNVSVVIRTRNMPMKSYNFVHTFDSNFYCPFNFTGWTFWKPKGLYTRYHSPSFECL